jgi:multisubunit Na+/H+ antiporter MnhF subunit
MDWQIINGVISSAAALALTKVVLDPEVHEGIIIKSGMVTMILSLLGTAMHMFAKSEDFEALVRAFISLVSGIGIVLFGGFLRAKRGKRINDIFGVRHGSS